MNILRVIERNTASVTFSVGGTGINGKVPNNVSVARPPNCMDSSQIILIPGHLVTLAAASRFLPQPSRRPAVQWSEPSLTTIGV